MAGPSRIQYLQNPKVEIILHDQATGEGIQKTLAYDTPMSKEELEKWRDEFWGKLNFQFLLFSFAY